MSNRERVYTKVIAVRVDELTWEGLSELAAALDRPPAVIIREWIGERLQLEQEAARGFAGSIISPDQEAAVVDHIVKSAIQGLTATAYQTFVAMRDDLREDIERQVHEQYAIGERATERAEEAATS